MLEIPAGPVITNMSPSAARKIWLDHRLNEGASILVLNERLVEQTRRQSQGNIIHPAARLRHTPALKKTEAAPSS
jgi:hypothetical protein